MPGMRTNEPVAQPILGSTTVCHIGDIVERGDPARPERAIVTWVGPTHRDVYLTYLQCPVGDGAWRGTISTPGIVKHIGFDPEQELAQYEISPLWTVVDAQWPSGSDGPIQMTQRPITRRPSSQLRNADAWTLALSAWRSRRRSHHRPRVLASRPD